MPFQRHKVTPGDIRNYLRKRFFSIASSLNIDPHLKAKFRTRSIGQYLALNAGSRHRRRTITITDPATPQIMSFKLTTYVLANKNSYEAENPIAANKRFSYQKVSYWIYSIIFNLNLLLESLMLDLNFFETIKILYLNNKPELIININISNSMYI